MKLKFRKRNCADKLRAMQVLVSELASEEADALLPNAPYELFTSYGNETAAQVLGAFLDATKEEA